MTTNKIKHKKQNRQLHLSLDNAERIREAREHQKAFYLKVSDFLLDLAKLVFGGIILTGIIDLDLDKVWLFSVEAIVALGLALWALQFIDVDKKLNDKYYGIYYFSCYHWRNCHHWHHLDSHWYQTR